MQVHTRHIAKRVISSNPVNNGICIALLGILAVLTAGCGAGGPQENAYTGTSQTASDSADSSKAAQGQPSSDGVLGMWEGTTVARCPGSIFTRCGAQQKVAIALREADNSAIAGSYTCAYGNRDCYDQNDTGKVSDGTLRGSRITFRVVMPDVSSCLFSGNVTNNTINGGYSCYNGGSIFEQGGWLAHKAY
jgi:hypothetical protein